MRDRLVFTNIADRSTDEAFNIQVQQFLSFLEGRIDEVVKYSSEVGEDEIQLELGKIASEAVKEHQLRWRILDYLVFWEIDLNGSDRLELIKSCLLLIQTAMNGSIPSENPKLIKCVRTLFSEKPIGHAPLDLYRPVGNEIWNKDLAGYQDCVRQGTLLALSVNLHRIFVLFGLILPSPTPSKKSFQGDLTRSQQEVYGRLEHFLQLKLFPRIAGGIQVRPHALLIGPSGVGKTALVRGFAEDLLKKRGVAFPLFIADPGTFIPDGARSEPNTLRAIKQWMWREVEQVGIIFIDELDKLYAQQDWGRSVAQNVLSLLDNRLNFSVPYWTETDSRLLEEKVMIIGAGTWQKTQKAALTDSANVSRKGARIDRIERDSEIPEELLFRFNADVVYLDPMLEVEIQDRIARIHQDLNLRAPVASRIAELASRASSSNRQMRWLEAYVSKLIEKQYLAEQSAKKNENGLTDLEITMR